MENEIRIRETFREQYTLWITSDMMAVNAKMQNKTQIRWDFTVLEIHEDFFEARLLLLDHTLLATNNDLAREVSQLTQAFGRMYNELYVRVSHQGEILKILNLDIIQTKWSQTKAEMKSVAENSNELKSLINLNDSIFLNKENLKKSIQAGEFFSLYFNRFYGKTFPVSSKTLNRENFFNSARILWNYQAKVTPSVPLHSDRVLVSVSMQPLLPLAFGFYSTAYAQFSKLIDISKLKTNMYEKSEYLIEPKNGKLEKAKIIRNEIADEKHLFTKVKYEFMDESTFKEKVAANKEANVKSATEKRPNQSFFVDEE